MRFKLSNNIYEKYFISSECLLVPLRLKIVLIGPSICIWNRSQVVWNGEIKFGHYIAERLGDLSIRARLIKTVRRVANPSDSRSLVDDGKLIHSHQPSWGETPFLPIYSGKSAKVCAMCYRRDPGVRIVVRSRTNKKVERSKARTPGPGWWLHHLAGFHRVSQSYFVLAPEDGSAKINSRMIYDSIVDYGNILLGECARWNNMFNVGKIAARLSLFR